MDSIVRLEHVSKRFGDNVIIDDVTLDVKKGDFLTLLGPSGCGKTTILRMISGLESVSSGKVYIDGVDVTDVDPTKRETNTIFQNFALFPHLTIYDNIAFGLRIKKLDEEKIAKEVKNAIKLVNLEGLEERKPSELSGGQQQRVAIARGIVMNPKVLLLDEPLCSLDLKLKKKMQIELKKLQKKLGITFIYVTHDQDEALTMSTKIAIINKGKIEQLDEPENIYRSPNTVFVADFIGESNILKGKVVGKKIDVQGLRHVFDAQDHEKGEYVSIILRPETIILSHTKKAGYLPGVITEYIYDGEMSKFEIKVDDITLKVHNNNMGEFVLGDKVYLGIDEDYLVVIGEEHEKR